MLSECGVPPHVLSLQAAPFADLVEIGLSVDCAVSGDTGRCEGEFLQAHVPPAQCRSIRALFHTHFSHVFAENAAVVRCCVTISDDGGVEVSQCLRSPVDGSGGTVFRSRSSGV